ncbi:DsbA family protein [Methylocapsa acidiphila]|uniref:DsbA family protein n=1 Tax=Methylocapsa acidiphila TaxID=133552 RepID=UPI00041DD9CC|nr:DsbA family protein [Methylocapsa acidiphila]
MFQLPPAPFRHLASLAATFAIVAFALPFAPARAEPFTPEQKSEIQSIIKDYLLEKPEILREAIGELEARDKLAEAKARNEIVGNPSNPLFSGAKQAVIGNPNGKITLVEFFDYNCGYCKRALNDLARLMKENPDLRIVLRDLPILSPGSTEAARIANAANNQIKGAKFWEFHQKLLGARGHVGKAEALAVAKDLGLDMERLGKDAEAAGATAGVDESLALAKSLQVTGTPTYVVGEDVIVGAVGYDELQAKVANVRKCGKAVCS